ncbi:MAG: hypothetical protein ACRC4T_15630 [Cetobacterium sp.]
MRPTSIIDEALGLTMGTTGILIELHSTVEKDYLIDSLDDARREEYIKITKEAIERLGKFAEQFQDKTFYNWVKRYSNFLKHDLKKQLHYEALSDKLRDRLYTNINNRKEQLRNENQKYDLKFFEKSFSEDNE